MDYYYEDKESISNEEVDSLTNNVDKQGFTRHLFGTEDRQS